MKTKTEQPLSPFATLTLALDAELTTFYENAEQLERLSIDSDKGMDKAISLLNQIEATRKTIQVKMVEFGKILEEVRKKNDAAEAFITHLLPKIDERQKIASALLTRFQTLGAMVTKINQLVSEFKDKTQVPLSKEDQEQIMAQLPEIDSKLEILVEEAAKLVSESRTHNMNTLERDADSLRKSLAAARNRLNLLSQVRGSGDGIVH